MQSARLYQHKSQEAAMVRSDTLRALLAPDILRRLAGLAARARDRQRDRILLARLDPHLLRDIGLTDADVRRECAKPFWRP
jgi:uncharacterized protein YjiS (DUF1127 family)